MKHSCQFWTLVLLVSFTAHSSRVFAQVQDTALLSAPNIDLKINANGRGYFELIDTVSGTKEVLFVKAKQWVYKTYNSGDAVIQMEDKEAGLIECKGKTKLFKVKNSGFWHDLGFFNYSMTLRFKEGRYKCTISNITFVKSGDLWIKEGADFSETYPSNWNKAAYKKSPEWWQSMKDSATAEFRVIVLSLWEAMSKGNKSSDDGW